MLVKAVDTNDLDKMGREMQRQILSDITNTLYTYTYNIIESHSDSLNNEEQGKLFYLLELLNREINTILPFPEYEDNIVAYA